MATFWPPSLAVLDSREDLDYMAQTMKRLLHNWEPVDISQEELERWRRAGVEPNTLLFILESAAIERRKYEAQLRTRLIRTSPQKVRELQKALKNASPLIRFLKTEMALNEDGKPQFVFGYLGEQIERAVQSYIDTRLPGPTRRGRPADGWLNMAIILLASHLMSFTVSEPGSGRLVRPERSPKQSEKSAIRAIERVLKLAGHGDLVTKEKIRHVIRKLRRLVRENFEAAV